MITDLKSDMFMIKANMMDYWFKSLFFIILDIVVQIYTYITLPIYFVLQKPKNVLKNSQRIRAKPLNENDPKSPWFGVLNRQDYRGSVIDIAETVDEMCNKLGEYISLKNKAVGYRRVLREYIVYDSDGKTPLKSDGKIIKKRELSDYDWLSYEQLFERKNNIAKGLLSVGIKHNEPIAILCETCVEYLMMEFAIARAGFVQVNIFSTLGESAIAYAIKETNTKYIFVSWELLPKIRSVIQTYKLDVSKIIYIERRAENVPMEIVEKERDFIEPINQSSFVPFTKIEMDGRSCNDDAVICKPLDKNEIAFIVFTSGSTGVPKGVQLTSNHMIQVCHQMLPTLSEYICNGPNNTYVAYLPQAHILECTCEFLIFALGVPIGFASPLTLTESSPGLSPNTKSDLVILRPTFMISVPLVLQRIQKQIYNKLESRSSFHIPLFNYLMKYKIEWTKKGFKTPLINKVFCKKIREQFGGRLNKIIVGGAPLSSNLQALVKAALDTTLVQGYGMTETCGACFCMDNDDFSYGRSGPPMLGVYAKLDDWNEGGYRTSDLPHPRGELLVGSKANCVGYLNKPEATNDLIVKDEKLGINWIRSGDIAEVYSDGTFKIIDRKKDLVKMANGEYVSLGKIETTLKNCNCIDHICVFGDALANYLVALVVPNAEKLGLLAQTYRIPDEARSTIRMSEILLKSVHETGIKNGLKKMEIPTKIQIVSDEWTSDNEMLTAAMKLKRCSIKSRYFSVINDLFDDSYNNSTEI
ncbi:long chain fatty acid CoA ligase-like protein [Euroglyphus maynei]|uniref:long-chain-fatty-acid--CoA ligase n=1 Tax=Euroglyphus maynei TaxID=6958 RepID=A0A1Y3BHT9_EURMA|nr:long chain fatty acid CoA ligase-like protein [Euroglyphus maynei]